MGERTISVSGRNGLKPIATIDISNQVFPVQSQAPPSVKEMNLKIATLFTDPNLKQKNFFPEQFFTPPDLTAYCLELLPNWRRCTAMIVLQRSSLGSRLVAYTDSKISNGAASFGTNCEQANGNVQPLLDEYINSLRKWQGGRTQKKELDTLRNQMLDIAKQIKRASQQQDTVNKKISALESQLQNLNSQRITLGKELQNLNSKRITLGNEYTTVSKWLHIATLVNNFCKSWPRGCADISQLQKNI